MHIPFTYIENCRIEDKRVSDGFRQFVSVACMVKNFRGMRIGQVGLRPKPFTSVIFNEGELIERFGLRIIPINMAVVIDKYNRILAEKDAELEEGAAMLAERYEVDTLSAPMLKKMYAFVLLYKELFVEYNLDVISAECWTSMQLGVGAMPCAVLGILNEMGYIVCGTAARSRRTCASRAGSRRSSICAPGSLSRMAATPSPASTRMTATTSCSAAPVTAPPVLWFRAPTCGPDSTIWANGRKSSSKVLTFTTWPRSRATIPARSMNSASTFRN